MIILRTLPAVAIGLFTRWFHRGGQIAGWVVGMASGLGMLHTIPNPVTEREHFGGSAFALSKLGLDTKLTICAGFLAVDVDRAVAKVPRRPGRDEPSEYFADEGDPKLHSEPKLHRVPELERPNS